MIFINTSFHADVHMNVYSFLIARRILYMVKGTVWFGVAMLLVGIESMKASAFVVRSVYGRRDTPHPTRNQL